LRKYLRVNKRELEEVNLAVDGRKMLRRMYEGCPESIQPF